MLTAALTTRSSSGRWWFAMLVATTCSVAVVIWLTAPEGWQSMIAAEQRTDGTIATAMVIWISNFVVVAAVPLIVASVAFSSRLEGHRRWALCLVLFVTVTELRNPVAIGFVGGLDPAWLAGASLWWAFELMAIAITCAAAWKTWPMTDREEALGVIRRAIVQSGTILAVSAVVEVALT